VLVLFPFEAPFYQARGVDAEFVGHPLARLPLPTISREDYVRDRMLFKVRHSSISSHWYRRWIALLPGSRWKEMTANLPGMLEAAALLGPGYDFLIPVANTLDKSNVSDLVFTEILPRLQ